MLTGKFPWDQPSDEDPGYKRWLAEYSNGNLTSLNNINTINNNSNSSSTTPVLIPLSTSKKRKINSTSVLNKRTSSTSSIDSLQHAISPISTDKYQTGLIN
ncbi:unnamed protein product [Rotaria sp. Silwood2]|nr:unnamed protein product [Rotaria sp. Silwood2]